MSVILKLTGAVLIVLCGTSIGFLRAKRYSGRVEDISWYISAIEFISQKIRFGMPDITDAVKGVYGSEKYYAVSRPFSVALKKSYLEKPQEDLINELFADLGKEDAPAEIKRCERYTAELKVYLEQAREKKKESARLCKLLGLFGGISLAVILI